jgi:hypothetical protein
MDRTAARALIKTTLEGLGTYQAVVQGVPSLFAGRSPIAVITSRSMGLEYATRELYTLPSGVSVAIYVYHDPEAAEGTSEDQLDSLTKAAMIALGTLEVSDQRIFDLGESSADPSSGNLRDVDRNGTLYRVERIPLTVLDEHGYE